MVSPVPGGRKWGRTGWSHGRPSKEHCDASPTEGRGDARGILNPLIPTLSRGEASFLGRGPLSSTPTKVVEVAVGCDGLGDYSTGLCFTSKLVALSMMAIAIAPAAPSTIASLKPLAPDQVIRRGNFLAVPPSTEIHTRYACKLRIADGLPTVTFWKVPVKGRLQTIQCMQGTRGLWMTALYTMLKCKRR